MSNIKTLLQYTDPERLSAITSERNKSELPSLKHGLRTSLAQGAVFSCHCSAKTCFMGYEELNECDYACSSGYCKALPAIQEYFHAAIAKHHWIKANTFTEPDFILVQQLARALTIQRYCIGMLQKAPEIIDTAFLFDDSTPGKLLKKNMELDRTIERLCDKLGLSPLSRSKLSIPISHQPSVMDAISQAQS